jgi:mannan endo-1,4-beta-mannosidase
MYGSRRMVDDVLGQAARAGFNTMRTWGFLDIGTPGGTDSIRGPSRDVYFQYWDGSGPAYNDGPDGLERLDYVIAQAGQLGLRLVIPLVNNWNDFGGMDQYVRWAETAAGGAGAGGRTWYHDDFYTDPLIIGWYKAWIAHVLGRTNTLTGVRYEDDPTIATWELGNEPRCTGTGAYGDSDACTTDTIVAWADELSRYVKSLDRSHLVSVGDEGFYCLPMGSHWTEQCGDGIDSRALLALPAVDVMSFHLYPDSWGTDAAWGDSWISRHFEDARALGKVALLGEFGIRDRRIRNRVYQNWLNDVTAAGGNALYWILSGTEDDGSRYGDFDGFTVYADDPVFQTLINFSDTMQGEGREDYPPVADHDSGFVTHDTSALLEPLANDIAYGEDAGGLLADLDIDTPGIQAEASVDGSTLESQGDGRVLVTPRPGYIGPLEFAYRAVDQRGRESNVAQLSHVVSPDPLAITSFEAGLGGWAPLNAMNGTLVPSTAFASDGGSSAEVVSTGNGNWYGVTLDPPLDLSARYAVSFDVQVGPEAGTNRAVRIQYDAVRCQSAFVWLPQNTSGEVQVDLDSMTCTGGTPDKKRATALYLRFNPGTFRFDNVKIK